MAGDAAVACVQRIRAAAADDVVRARTTVEHVGGAGSRAAIE